MGTPTTRTNGFELQTSETVNVSPLGATAFRDLNTLVTDYPAIVSAAENVVETIAAQAVSFACFNAAKDLNTLESDLKTGGSDIQGLSATTVTSTGPQLLLALKSKWQMTPTQCTET